MTLEFEWDPEKRDPDQKKHGVAFERQLCRALREDSNIVRLDPDVAKVFPDSAAVNDALRALVRIIQQRASASWITGLDTSPREAQCESSSASRP